MAWKRWLLILTVFALLGATGCYHHHHRHWHGHRHWR